jgi:hypothetical protein
LRLTLIYRPARTTEQDVDDGHYLTMAMKDVCASEMPPAADFWPDLENRCRRTACRDGRRSSRKEDGYLGLAMRQQSDAATPVCSPLPATVSTPPLCQSISRPTSSHAPSASLQPGTLPSSPMSHVLATQGPGRLCSHRQWHCHGRREPSGATRLEITLTKSVLHRAAPKPADSDRPCRTTRRPRRQQGLAWLRHLRPGRVLACTGASMVVDAKSRMMHSQCLFAARATWCCSQRSRRRHPPGAAALGGHAATPGRSETR